LFAGRNARLGEFSPLGQLFTSGNFLEITLEDQKFALCTVLHKKRYAPFFTAMVVGLHLGRFFLQNQLVALIVRQNIFKSKFLFGLTGGGVVLFRLATEGQHVVVATAEFSLFCQHAHERMYTFLACKVARFFIVQVTNTEKTIPNETKLYEMTIKYTKWTFNRPNGH
jgi:hypothetical protein